MINRQYKDATIKLFLTQGKGRLVRLVNSICGTNYPEDISVTDNTLEAPVFLEAHNDLSFCYDGNLHLMLVEHQATLNNNMAVRLLMYLGRVYEKLLESESVYATKRIPLPTPHLVVLYNGDAQCPDVQTFKLSDSFESHAWDEMPDAEVVVHMYNINYNEEAMPVLLRRNPELREYANFIQTARDYACAGMDKEEALRRAINDFAKTDTMGPFLEENASEVVNMLLTEWNTVDYGRVQRAEGRAEGVIQTLCKSLQAVMQNAQLSFERASAMLGLTPEEVEACRAELNQ